MHLDRVLHVPNMKAKLLYVTQALQCGREVQMLQDIAYLKKDVQQPTGS